MDFESSRKELDGKITKPSRTFFLKYEIAKHLQSVKLKPGNAAMDAEVGLTSAAH